MPEHPLLDPKTISTHIRTIEDPAELHGLRQEVNETLAQVPKAEDVLRAMGYRCLYLIDDALALSGV